MHPSTNQFVTDMMLAHQVPYLAWVKAYRHNPNHAIRDANKNLKGFSGFMRSMLHYHPLDIAFQKAIKHALRTI